MNYNFESEATLHIPKSVYRPFKRCEYCQSVYLTDNLCESCGRAVHYDVIGELHGFKSYYGIKERYVNNLPTLVKFYPIWENPKSSQAQTYCRQLLKRLADLSIVEEHQNYHLLMVEAETIIEELLVFSMPVDTIRSSLGNNFYLEKSLIVLSLNTKVKKKWYEGREVFVYISSITLLIAFVSILISLQFGR